MNNLILARGKYKLKESIELHVKDEYFKFILEVIHIKSLTELTLEYLNSSFILNVEKEEFIIYKYKSLFSIKEIPGNVTLNIMNTDDVNLINSRSDLEPRDDVLLNIDPEWFKNFDLIEVKDQTEALIHLITEKDCKPYVVHVIENDTIIRNGDIVEISPFYPDKNYTIRNNSNDPFYSGKETIYIPIICLIFDVLKVEGKINYKDIFLDLKARHILPKSKILYPKYNRIICSGQINDLDQLKS